jgi:hypothetical protein
LSADDKKLAAERTSVDGMEFMTIRKLTGNMVKLTL